MLIDSVPGPDYFLIVIIVNYFIVNFIMYSVIFPWVSALGHLHYRLWQKLTLLKFFVVVFLANTWNFNVYCDLYCTVWLYNGMFCCRHDIKWNIVLVQCGHCTSKRSHCVTLIRTFNICSKYDILVVNFCLNLRWYLNDTFSFINFPFFPTQHWKLWFSVTKIWQLITS